MNNFKYGEKVPQVEENTSQSLVEVPAVKAKITELGKIDEERVKKKQEEELLEQMQKLGQKASDESGQSTKEIKETKEIKKGVDFVFKQHPELAEIGTPEQYSQYLEIETVFPDSYVHNIVYHGGRQGIETFTKPHDESFQKNKGIGSGTKDYGIYFTADFSLAKHYSKSHKKRYIYPVLLNITNPYRANTRIALNIRRFFGSSIINPQSITDKDYQKFKENHQDGIIRHGEKGELIVFEPEQIHRLGSNKDKEAFKTFVNSTQK